MAQVIAPSNATEVIPRLWQGGKPSPGHYSFNLIVLVDDTYQPAASSFLGAEVLRIPLSDVRAATPTELEAARQAALIVVDWYRQGKSILVTCGAGLNRSGLITGLTLKMLGYSDAQLVQLIRAARGDHGLRNTGFLNYISKIGPVAAAGPPPAMIIAAVSGLVVGLGVLVGRRIAR